MHKQKPLKTFIYGIVDPRSGDVFYIGKSDDPQHRLVQHVADKTSNRDKAYRIAEIIAAGAYPGLKTLAHVLYADWPETEMQWIKNGLDKGWPLTNIVGNDGTDNRRMMQAEEVQEAMFSYLPADMWNRFCALDFEQQTEILLAVASAGILVGDLANRAAGNGPRDFTDMYPEMCRVAAECMVADARAQASSVAHYVQELEAVLPVIQAYVTARNQRLYRSF